MKCLSLAAVVFALTLNGTALADPSVAVGGDLDYPPSSWFHDGRLFGVGPHLVETALAERGLAVSHYAEVPWKRALALTRHGEIDLLTSVYLTGKRDQALRYVPTPYMDDTIVVWVHHQRRFAFTDLADLEGRRGVMIIGYSGGEAFDRYADELDIQRLGDIELCLQLLALGRADYLVFSAAVGRVLADSLGYGEELVALAQPLAEEPLYLAVAPDSPLAEEIDFLDDRIRQYRRDGRIARWVESYGQLYRQHRRQGPEQGLSPAQPR